MRKLVIMCCGILFLCCFILTGILVKHKVITLNTWFARKYVIMGVDVSHYQGKIDWNKIEAQNVGFAIVKATEGSRCQDECFQENWTHASETDLVLGAYHFFSFDSQPETQAENYIKTVGSLKGKLPPVVDFEYYGNKQSNPPDVESARKNLRSFLELLEKQYGEKPIIYATMKTYRRYLKGHFDEYPLWIRNVYYTPDIDLKGKWKFWQYSSEGLLDGYEGKEKYVDFNVFDGSLEELEKLIINP